MSGEGALPCDRDLPFLPACSGSLAAGSLSPGAARAPGELSFPLGTFELPPPAGGEDPLASI